MDDRELERLVRMAVEAEELEHSADGPLAFGRAPTGRRWVGVVVSATAAAAGLLLAFTMLVRFASPAPEFTGPVADGSKARPIMPHVVPEVVPESAHASAADATPAPKAPAEGCVVMAFYQGSDGECSCLSIRSHEWEGGRRLADVARAELMDVAFEQQCSSDAQQVFVIAVAGNPATLPTTRDEAEAIGRRLAGAPRGRGSDISSYAYSALPKLGADSTVIAERLAIRPVSQVRETLAAFVSKHR